MKYIWFMSSMYSFAAFCSCSCSGSCSGCSSSRSLRCCRSQTLDVTLSSGTASDLLMRFEHNLELGAVYGDIRCVILAELLSVNKEEVSSLTGGRLCIRDVE